MPRIRQPELTRAALLAAASTVLREQGASLSLDAVARAAGVSKGGLLHHYPTRDALLRALGAALIDDFRQRLNAAHAAELAAHGPARGAWLRAYIALTFTPDEDEKALHAALAPLAGHPALLAGLSEAQAFLLTEPEHDGLPAGTAHAIRLACDGYWMGDLTGLPRLNDTQAQALRETLTAWTR